VSPLLTQAFPVAGSAVANWTPAEGSSAVAVTAKVPVSTRRRVPPEEPADQAAPWALSTPEHGAALEGEGALVQGDAGGDVDLG
jgi:hypothetical protein